MDVVEKVFLRKPYPFEKTFSTTPIKNNNIRYIIADKGYDADAIRSCIEVFGQKPVIPYRKNRKSKKEICELRYQSRNIIERVFGRIKEFRRVATRYDKLDSRFLSFIACAFIAQIICYHSLTIYQEKC